VQGNADSVERVTADDVQAFVRRHYTPDRIIIAAAGNVEHDALVEQIRDGFWRLSGTSPDRRVTRSRFRSGVTLDESPVSQAYFAIGLAAPAYGAVDRYPLFLLNSVLGGGMSSRLFRKLREERGMVYGISSELHAYRDAGAWVIEGSTTPEHLRSVLALAILELQQLATFETAIDEEELWTAKMQVRGQHLLSAEDAHTRMSRLATQELYFGWQTCRKQLLPAADQLALSVVGPEASECYSQESLEDLLGEFALCAA
jgi:predicted Zn-dependent peptidase